MSDFLFDTLWITSGSALVLYPFILLANVMSFAGKKKTRVHNQFTSFRKRFKHGLFTLMLIVTTLFPILYYAAYKTSRYFLVQHKIHWAAAVMLPCLVISIALFWFLFRPLKKKTPR